MKILSRKKILFIVHDSSRSGAPLVLLSFLQWLKINGDSEFEILVLKDGPLKKDFEDLATTHLVSKNYKYSLKNKVRRRIHPNLSNEYKMTEVVDKLSRKKFDIIFGNTIVSLPWLLHFKKLYNNKVVCSIHELTNVIKYYFEKDYIVKELQNVDSIIAGSQVVKSNLVEEFGITADKIEVVHAFINTHFNISSSSKNLRRQLGIKDNELIIGAMGLAELRKGIDLVAPLARELKNKYSEIPFKLIWVGGKASDNVVQIVKRDAKKCGVEDCVVFIEDTPYPDDYLNLYDIFVLLSREDPFPLVLLSSANMEKAIIAFKESGGAEELLIDGAGFLAPYLNTAEMARIISTLYNNGNLIRETGRKAKEKVEKEFSADVIPARLYDFLNQL